MLNFGQGLMLESNYAKMWGTKQCQIVWFLLNVSIMCAYYVVSINRLIVDYKWYHEWGVMDEIMGQMVRLFVCDVYKWVNYRL